VSHAEAVPADLAFLQWLVEECGCRDPKPIGGGQYACILRKAFTHAIITGRIGDEFGFNRNYCFETYQQAKAALDAWDGQGEPVGWFRDPTTGRRVSRSPDEIDGDGNEVGAIGVLYVRW